MFRYVVLLVFLAILPWSFCGADTIDYSDIFETTEAPFNDVTTTLPPTTTKAAKTTTTPKATTTAAPTTTTITSTAAPTTTAKQTTAAPTTTTKQTTAAPTTTTTKLTTTTKAPTTTTSSTNTTSSAPNTTTTTATPTTTTAPPLPEPSARKYEVKKGADSCLIVYFGLRIGVQGAKYEEMNLVTNNLTVVNGSCAEDNSTLVIETETLTLSFTFHNDTKKFSLFALNATGKLNSGESFSESNNNLSMWQASLGSSYMCTKKQNYTITENLTIFTFKLQVQPFGVKNSAFSLAQECSMDDTSILIPIVVGAALAGLILIVVIAYVIGRRKTYVGYQTL